MTNIDPQYKNTPAKEYYIIVRDGLVAAGLFTSELFYSLIEARVNALEDKSEAAIKETVATAAVVIRDASVWVESVGEDFGMKRRLEGGCGYATGLEDCGSETTSLEAVIRFVENQIEYPRVEAIELCLSTEYGKSVSWRGQYLRMSYTKIKPDWV